MSTEQYYCHVCTAPITPVLPDYTCPTCNGGFIEPVEAAPSPPVTPVSDPVRQYVNYMSVMHPLLRDFHNVLETQRGGAATPTTMHESGAPRPIPGTLPGTLPGAVPGATRGGSVTVPTTSTFPHLITGPAPYQTDAGSSHHIISSTGPPQPMLHGRGGAPFPFTQMVRVSGDMGSGDDGVPTLFNQILASIMTGQGQDTIVGNPDDYAWGAGGMDNIISQLMGQIHGLGGPPPAAKDAIDSLADTTVPAPLIESGLDCTVCQEVFTETEPVKMLPCKHYFHSDCILPWLDLHNSCPVCRLSIDGTDTSNYDVDMVLEDQEEEELPSEPVVMSEPAVEQSIGHEDDLD